MAWWGFLFQEAHSARAQIIGSAISVYNHTFLTNVALDWPWNYSLVIRVNMTVPCTWAESKNLASLEILAWLRSTSGSSLGTWSLMIRPFIAMLRLWLIAGQRWYGGEQILIITRQVERSYGDSTVLIHVSCQGRSNMSKHYLTWPACSRFCDSPTIAVPSLISLMDSILVTNHPSSASNSHLSRTPRLQDWASRQS